MKTRTDLDLIKLPKASQALRTLTTPAHRDRWRNGAEVIAGSLLATCATLEPDARDDVASSLLLAQLAADEAADKFGNPRDWMDNVLNIMGAIGWQTHQTASQGQRTFDDRRDWRAMALEAFERGHGAPAPLVRRMVSAAVALPEYSPGATLWHSHSARAGQGIFILGLADADPAGNAILSLMFATFRLELSQNGILNWHTGGEWADEFVVLKRDPGSYDPLRDAINARLGSWRNTDIHEIALQP